MGFMSDDFSELLSVCKNGDLDAVKSLLDKGVDINADFGAPRGWSPLMTAAFHGHLAIVKLLVEQGADLAALEIDRWATALDLAEANEKNRVAKYLISVKAPRGAQVPNRYRDGKLGGWIEDKPN